MRENHFISRCEYCGNLELIANLGILGSTRKNICKYCYKDYVKEHWLLPDRFKAKDDELRDSFCAAHNVNA